MSQWQSKYHTQLKRHLLDTYKVEFGEARAATLTNIWFNYHYGGCTYNNELMNIIKTWPDPKNALKCKNELTLHPSNQTGKEEIEEIPCISFSDGDDNSQHQQDVVIIEKAESNVHNKDKKYGPQTTKVTPLKVKQYSNFCKPSVVEPASDITDNVDDDIMITKVIQSKTNKYTANFCKSSNEVPARIATPPPEIVNTETDSKAFVDPYKIDDELGFIPEDLDISSLEELCYNLINNRPMHTSNPITVLKICAKKSITVLNYHQTMTGSMVIDTRNESKMKIRKTKNEDYQKVADDNIGNMLLRGMGWTEGTGLGKNEQGMVNPIVNMGQVSRHGLGTENHVSEVRKLCPGHMSSLEINGIFVAHGIGCKQKLAKAKCAQNAIDYLTKRFTQSGTFTKLNYGLDIATLNFQLHLHENHNATSILHTSAEKSGAEIAFIESDPDDRQGNQCSVRVEINNVYIACGAGRTSEEARLASAKQAISHLKSKGVEQYDEEGAVVGALVMSKTSGLLEHNWPTQADEDWDAETSQSGYNNSNNGWNGWDDKDSEITMTWDSGTSANKNQSWKNFKHIPAGHESAKTWSWEKHCVNRQLTVSKSEMEQKLLDFIENRNVMEMAFPVEMSNADRKLVHLLADVYGLKHKSKGRPGVNRQLFVSKK